METKKEELAFHLEKITQALKSLSEVLQEPYSVIVRDASIQRFEYTFELAWKLFKKLAKTEGIEASSPRQAIRSAFDLDLIDNTELWFEFLEHRNATSHTYNQMLADEVFKSVKKFPKALQQVLSKVDEKNK